MLPSYSENFGIAAAEALAFGIPSVLSNQVAIAREPAAIVVSPDAGEIACGIKILLADPAKREELSRNARVFAEREFSPERISEQLVSEYRKILSRTSER